MRSWAARQVGDQASTLGVWRRGRLKANARSLYGERGQRRRRQLYIRRLLTTTDSRPSTDTSEEELIQQLNRELERARRFDRAFSLTRFTVTGSPAPQLEELVARSIRTSDAVGTLQDQLVVLWGESSASEVAVATDRLVSATNQRLRPHRTVEFPRHALTSAALLEKLLIEPTKPETVSLMMLHPSVDFPPHVSPRRDRVAR